MADTGCHDYISASDYQHPKISNYGVLFADLVTGVDRQFYHHMKFGCNMATRNDFGLKLLRRFAKYFFNFLIQKSAITYPSRNTLRKTQ